MLTLPLHNELFKSTNFSLNRINLSKLPSLIIFIHPGGPRPLYFFEIALQQILISLQIQRQTFLLISTLPTVHYSLNQMLIIHTVIQSTL